MSSPADTATRYLLPPTAYTGQDWFDAEAEQLFERTWVFAGVEHDLAAPGDVINVQVGRAPVIVVRGGDGEVRAFHNVCRHRGLPLVDEDGNCGKALICPYHRWNFGLDGRLRSVPQRDQYGELDMEQLGLRPVRCETWKTLVFVDVAGDAEPLDAWLAGIDTLFENFHPETLVQISDQRHDVAANWKLYVENHVDWLHLWYLHENSLGHYDHAGGERHEFGRHWASFEYYRGGGEAGAADGPSEAPTPEAATPEDQHADDGREPSEALLPIPGLDTRDASNGAHFIFPSLTLFTNDGYWMLGQLIPVDPDHFQLRLRVFGMAGSDGATFEKNVNIVMFEDYRVATAIQRAMASPAFEVGPLASVYEREIMRFHQHYLELVSPPG